MTYKMTYKDGKNVREHVLIAEEKIGRKLKKNEVVHHMDGDKMNNNPENLTVVTRGEHAKIHANVLDKSKEVVQIEKQNGSVIKTWDSATEAAEFLGIFNTSISMCCHGKLKTSGGFLWKFAE